MEYADCVVIESCGTEQNLFDKRSRYAARTTSTLLELRRSWLEEEIRLPGRGGPLRSRGSALGGTLGDLRERERVVLPVRHLRVLYALPDEGPQSLLARVRNRMTFEAHEFVCPQRLLTQWNLGGMQDFLKRMAPDVAFYT